MSNLDKAVEVLREAYRETSMSPVHACEIMANALQTAGLLMPDLPEPDSHDERGWPIYGETEYTTHFDMHPFKRIPYINCPLGEWLSADMAREEAYRLLAAAEWLDSWDKKHAEKEQGNE